MVECPFEGKVFSNATGILPKKKWIIGVEVEQETSAPPPPPKKNPGSAPGFRFEDEKDYEYEIWL